MSAEHQRVDVVRAFVRLHRLEIAHVPEDRVFVDDPVGSQQVSGPAGNLEGHLSVVALDHRDVRMVKPPVVLEPRGVQRDELRLRDLGDHPSQLVLHELVRGDRPVAELLA